jgi:hypothetical protein
LQQEEGGARESLRKGGDVSCLVARAYTGDPVLGFERELWARSQYAAYSTKATRRLSGDQDGTLIVP